MAQSSARGAVLVDATGRARIFATASCTRFACSTFSCASSRSRADLAKRSAMVMENDRHRSCPRLGRSAGQPIRWRGETSSCRRRIAASQRPAGARHGQAGALEAVVSCVPRSELARRPPMPARRKPPRRRALFRGRARVAAIGVGGRGSARRCAQSGSLRAPRDHCRVAGRCLGQERPAPLASSRSRAQTREHRFSVWSWT